jgi:hypothetical protein
MSLTSTHDVDHHRHHHHRTRQQQHSLWVIVPSLFCGKENSISLDASLHKYLEVLGIVRP